jgi:hypothetical protein
MVESEWEGYIEVKRKELLGAPGQAGGKNQSLDVAKHTESPIVYYNGIHYVPNLLTWARKVYSYSGSPVVADFKVITRHTVRCSTHTHTMRPRNLDQRNSHYHLLFYFKNSSLLQTLPTPLG